MITIVILTVALVTELIMIIIAKICTWLHTDYGRED
jgi:hypothetical protein